MPYQRKSNDRDAEDIALAFEMAGVGLCISRRRIIYRCNREFAEIFGYAGGELKGHTFERLYPSRGEYESVGMRGIEQMRVSGRYFDERIMQRKDGSLFWCRVVGRSLYQENPFACAVWSVEDISAQRPVEPALSGREREVAQMIIAGKTSKEVGTLLGISSRTVEVYRARLMRKYGAKSLVDLIQKIRGLR